ncbi:MAG TPA: alpha/beta hydrolase [Streptosporangiales bacterium]
MHGGVHASWVWSNLQGWFAGRGWSSTALDWFGHGDSAPLPLEDMLRRGIVDVTEEIGIACAASDRRPVLVGHSMGGLAALAYAAAEPDALAALVLLTPGVPSAYAGPPVEVPVDRDALWGPPPPDVARALFYSGVDDAAAARYHRMLQPESPEAVYQATRWTVDLDLTPLRGSAILVVAAEADPLVTVDALTAMASDIGADRILLPAAGHGVILDPGWPDLAARVETWLVAALGEATPSP